MAVSSFMAPKREKPSASSITRKEMSPLNASVAASDEKMEWSHFIGVGGKGLSAISILTPGCSNSNQPSGEIGRFCQATRNPLCSSANQFNVTQFCGPRPDDNVDSFGGTSNSTNVSRVQACPTQNFYEYVLSSLVPCFCAAPIKLGYRLKSPSISMLLPYVSCFYICSCLALIWILMSCWHQLLV
ncbi:uncharacterized protein LOC116245032 isoform X1 [Nymphaea colorata]|uniref:uncharacterized protein LOC116245032 isoform X1 n=1 Tax=Nymphaea colorata TaxID=210225 RepID=UPI00129E1183|nr:uncharacterized protein LOC116245032 isoform X1 [Nymphaea colorata]